MEFKIGAVSKMTGLSPSGIRFLEEQGLLSPSGGRKGSYRSFSLADVSTLLDYRNYRKCGFTQDEILTLIKNEDHRNRLKPSLVPEAGRRLKLFFGLLFHGLYQNLLSEEYAKRSITLDNGL